LVGFPTFVNALFQAVGDFVNKMLASFFFDLFSRLMKCPANVNTTRSIVAGFFLAVAVSGVVGIFVKASPVFAFLSKDFSRFDIVFQ
jgi:hypothetical protein